MIICAIPNGTNEYMKNQSSDYFLCQIFKEHLQSESKRPRLCKHKIRYIFSKGNGFKSGCLGISCDILEFLEISTNIHTTRHKKSTRIKSDA
jgi:hypothetical protein